MSGNLSASLYVEAAAKGWYTWEISAGTRNVGGGEGRGQAGLGGLLAAHGASSLGAALPPMFCCGACVLVQKGGGPSHGHCRFLVVEESKAQLRAGVTAVGWRLGERGRGMTSLQPRECRRCVQIDGGFLASCEYGPAAAAWRWPLARVGRLGGRGRPAPPPATCLTQRAGSSRSSSIGRAGR
jgi:hypothetical protein